VTDRRTDGETDRQTEFSSLDRVCIPCSAVKITKIYETKTLQILHKAKNIIELMFPEI